MSPLPRRLRSLRRLRHLSCIFALLFGAIIALPNAHAQKQEDGILTKVKQGGSGNRESFGFSDANKSFGVASAVGNKQAVVKTYNFGSKSSVFGVDGKFRTKSFETGGFRTTAYGSKASSVSQRNSFAQADRSFATKSMDVREAPFTNKAMAVRSYSQANQTYYGRGKRQDFLDEHTQGAKNLSIDQVRDLLNKGPEAKPGTLLEPVVPVVR